MTLDLNLIPGSEMTWQNEFRGLVNPARMELASRVKEKNV